MGILYSACVHYLLPTYIEGLQLCPTEVNHSEFDVIHEMILNTDNNFVDLKGTAYVSCKNKHFLN